MRVAYLIVTRSFPGLMKQVETDRALTQNLQGITWSHFTFLDSVDEGSSAFQLPFFLRGVFGRKLFAWYWMLRYARQFDFVIVRHMEFDPFALLFAWFVPNRLSVHHSKEVVELQLIRTGWQGKAASMLERVSGWVSVRTASGILGVTREVCEYQKESKRLPERFPVGFFPNGVVVEDMPLLEDERSSDIVEIGFICGTFAAWHGLDLLLESLRNYVSNTASYPVRLHLIGRLSNEQFNQVSSVNEAAGIDVVIAHGRLQPKDYIRVLARCHIGIGSLAMDRIQMKEGATLKVREMLALGLPVFSGHTDTAIPDEFPYYEVASCDMEHIVAFAQKMSAVVRQTVREASTPYIDKRVWIEGLGVFLSRLSSGH